MSNRNFVKNQHSTKSTRRTVGQKSARSGSKLAKLRGQSSSLKTAKMAAARMLANATTAGFLGIEKKFLDTCRTQVAIGAAVDLTGGEYDPSATSGPGGASGGCVGCLSCPAQGDTEQSRDGKRIVIDSLVIKGNVNFNSSASQAVTEPVKVFVAIILDSQTNGAQLSSEEVFKNLSADAVQNCAPLKNLLSGNRFRILKSHVFDVTPTGIASAGAVARFGVQREFDWYIPFKGGMPVNLNAGTTANVGNVIDNSLHVVAFATLGTAEICYNARVRFQG